MLQQQRATIEVHLSVGDPGLPQVIAASLRVGVRAGERKYTQIQARTHTSHTHTHALCTSLALSCRKVERTTSSVA